MALTPTSVTGGSLSMRDMVLLTSLQTTKGAINTSPVFEPVRRISGALTKKVNWSQSENLNQGYNPNDQIKGSSELTCAFESATSKQAIRYIIEALYAAETTYSLTAATFATLVNGFTVPAAAYAALSVGDGFWISGTTNPLNSGFYFVASKSGGTTIVTTIAPAATEAAGASVTLKSNRYTNANNAYYRTFQNAVTDLSAGGDNISRLTGYDGIPNSATLSIAEEGETKTSMEYMVEREVAGYAAIAGQTVTAMPTDATVSAVGGVLAFYVNGLLNTCTVKSMELSLALNQEGDNAAGCGMRYARGTPEFSGSVAVRTDKSNPFVWRNYSFDGTRVAIAARISHGNGEESTIVVRRAVVTEAEPDVGSVIANTEASYAAELDQTIGHAVAVYTNWTV
jgi:hypothetical protein